MGYNCGDWFKKYFDILDIGENFSGKAQWL